MKQSGHLNANEETGTGYSVTSKYGSVKSHGHHYSIKCSFSITPNGIISSIK